MRNVAMTTAAAMLLAACSHGSGTDAKATAAASPAAASPVASAAGTPGAGSEIALTNADFEQPLVDGNPPGWFPQQHAGEPAYDMGLDTAQASSGHQSFRITRLKEQIFGSIVQPVANPGCAGGELELSAMLKSRDVGPEGWKLQLNIGEVSVFSAPLSGTTAWQRVSVRAKVPARADSADLTAILVDAGTGWVDDVHLRCLK